jgi:hypothetical protein
MQQLAFEIAGRGFVAYMGEGGEDVRVAEAGADLRVMLLPEVDKTLRAKQDQTLKDPARLMGCHFHDHKDTKPCDSE